MRKPWWERPGRTADDLRAKFSGPEEDGSQYHLIRDVGSRYAAGVFLVRRWPEQEGGYNYYHLALRGNSKQRRQQYRAITRYLRTVSATGERP